MVYLLMVMIWALISYLGLAMCRLGGHSDDAEIRWADEELLATYRANRLRLSLGPADGLNEGEERRRASGE
jgi:hypothetical protein